MGLLALTSVFRVHGSLNSAFAGWLALLLAIITVSLFISHGRARENRDVALSLRKIARVLGK
jgi:hypothetical protein